MDSLPATMTAIGMSQPGGPDVLRPETRRTPRPGEGQILVKVEAAGVNRPDVAQRQGHYPPPPGAPDILGLEFAGKVVALGPNATRYAVGDRVTALVSGGGYAEYAVVHETNALPLPRGLSIVEAAALPETYFTVWSNVFERGHLLAGETILIHGGTSGIGTTAIQLARAFGAWPIATAGSDEKCAVCVKLGAEGAINYATQDFVAEVKRMTDGRGADVILDMIGGDYVDRNYAAAAMDGRILQIATLRGSKGEADFRRIMSKRLIHTGSLLRPRSVEFKAAVADAVLEKIWPLLEAKTALPVIDATFPLERAAEAHARIEAPHIGKIVLTVG